MGVGGGEGAEQNRCPSSRQRRVTPGCVSFVERLVQVVRKRKGKEKNGGEGEEEKRRGGERTYRDDTHYRINGISRSTGTASGGLWL